MPFADANARKQTAILLLPGFGRAESFERRDLMVKALCSLEGHEISDEGEISIPGAAGKKLALRSRGEAAPEELHVFESYWADMLQESAASNPWNRMIRDFQVMIYWMNFRMLCALSTSRYMTLGLVLGGMILFLWYLSTFVLAAEAIGADTSWDSQGVPRWALDAIVAAGASIGGWKLWAIVTLLLPVVRAEELSRLASFAKRFLEDEQVGGEIGLRSRIRTRIESSLRTIEDHGYEEIVIVAHSFGTVIATDIFAQRRKARHGQRLRLVTWGSPVAVLQYRSRWMRAELTDFAKSRSLDRWDDVHSKNDWICAAHPARGTSELPGQSYPIEFDVSVWKRWTGRSHLEYFTHSTALALLLSNEPTSRATPE